ncbi:MAG: STAS domain-containing protein [Bacteroidota bacterium]
MSLKSTTLDDKSAVVLEPKGSLIGGAETDELKEKLIALHTSGIVKVILDFADVTYLNSSAIGVLVVAHNTFKGKNGKLILCNVNKSIDNIFLVTKLTSLLTVEDNREDAIFALGK